VCQRCSGFAGGFGAALDGLQGGDGIGCSYPCAAGRARGGRSISRSRGGGGGGARWRGGGIRGRALQRLSWSRAGVGRRRDGFCRGCGDGPPGRGWFGKRSCDPRRRWHARGRGCRSARGCFT
jgi:hypothetical protein